MSAKINKKFVPLTTKLSNGQTVEVITAKNVSAKPSWLNHVISNKAKSSIRHYLQNQQIEESFEEITRSFYAKHCMAQHGSSVSRIGQKRLGVYLDEISVDSIEDLYAELGMGNRDAQVVANYLLKDSTKERKTTTKRKPLAIRGTEGIAVKYATCCFPILHDHIVGTIEPGKGLMIHPGKVVIKLPTLLIKKTN